MEVQGKFVDRFVDVSVIMQRQVPAAQVVQKTVEVPQTHFIDRKVDVPVVQQTQVDPQQTNVTMRLRNACRVGEKPTELSVENHSLLSDAYKNAVRSQCTNLRTITNGSEQQIAYARKYVVRVETDLQKIHDGVLALKQ